MLRPGHALAGALLAACAAWACYWHFAVPVLPYDDAFIAYRYVDRFSHGLGLTYNPAQHVWGFTSPLYVLWLSGIWRVVSAIDLPTLAVRTNALFLLSAAWAAFLLTREYTQSVLAGTVAAAVILAHSAMLTVSTGGMESMLFVTCMLLTLLMLARDRPWAAGILMGLACLTRPEGVLLAPVMAWTYRRSWRRLLSSGLTSLLVIVPWLSFAQLYYGSIVPMPIVAKSRPLYPLRPGYALDSMVGFLRGALFNPLSAWWPEAATVAFWMLVGCAVLAVVTSPALRRRQAWAVVALTCLLLAFYAITNPMFFEWYWPAVFVGVVMTFVLGATAVVRWLGAHVRPSRRHIGGIVAAGLAGFALFACVFSYRNNLSRNVRSVTLVREDAQRLRITAYRSIAESLNPLVHPGDAVGAAEIGALGYYFAGSLLDACGLVSPEALPFLPVPDDERASPATGAISVEFVRATNPAWVVTMPVFAQKSLLVSDWFAERYQLVSEVPLPKRTFDNSSVLVFKRK